MPRLLVVERTADPMTWRYGLANRAGRLPAGADRLRYDVTTGAVEPDDGDAHLWPVVALLIRRAGSGDRAAMTVRVVDEVEAVEISRDSVRNGARRLLAGHSLGSIARRWNDLGLTTISGGAFTGGAVRGVLANPHRAGLIYHDGRPIGRLAGRADLDEVTWRAVLARLADPGRLRPPVRLLSGLVVCAVCGAPLEPDSAPTVATVYACRPSVERPVAPDPCGTVAMNADALDAYVTAALGRDRPATWDTMTQRAQSRSVAAAFITPIGIGPSRPRGPWFDPGRVALSWRDERDVVRSFGLTDVQLRALVDRERAAQGLPPLRPVRPVIEAGAIVSARKLARRQKDRQAAAGVPSNGIHAFGWNRVVKVPGVRRQGSGLVQVPAEADAIRDGVRRFLAGESWRQIARSWDALGLRPVRGAATFSSVTVAQVITNPRIAGLRYRKGIFVGKAAWPPVVDAATWDQILAEVAARSRRRNGPEQLLAGLLFCGVCGARMVAHALIYLCAHGEPDRHWTVSVNATTLDAYVSREVWHSGGDSRSAKARERTLSKAWPSMSAAEKRRHITEAVERITIMPTTRRGRGLDAGRVAVTWRSLEVTRPGLQGAALQERDNDGLGELGRKVESNPFTVGRLGEVEDHERL